MHSRIVRPVAENFGVFDRSRDVVIGADRDGHVVYVNAAARALIGDQRSWLECFQGEFRDAARGALGDVARGMSATFEWSADARAFSAEVTPIEGGVLCVSRDQTLLKRSEERARRCERMMVDTQGVAHLGTWEWNIAEPHATWSEELYRIYGLSRETYTPSYEAYLTMVHADDRARVIEATNRVFHEHVPYSHDERIFRPDGTMRYLHTWAFPVLDRDGKLTHLIGVCQDITDRALAEEALQRANTELETRVAERTRELEAFNAMVTHDLRAPLAVVEIVADALRRTIPPESQHQLERIRRAIDNMSTLIDDLLAFAQVNETSLRPEQIDVTAMALEIVAELRLGSQRVATIAIEPGLRVIADRGLLRVALSNLLGNAWKYTQPRDEARIEVGVTERDGARRLFVRDNGIGFDMAESRTIFEPFQRLNNAREFAGTGVGLATVRRILNRHGGSISAESKLGEGATFLIQLPAVE